MRRYRQHKSKKAGRSLKTGRKHNKRTHKRGGTRNRIDCTKYMNPDKPEGIRDNDIIMRDMCSLIMEKAKLMERTDISQKDKAMEAFPIQRELDFLKKELEEWNNKHDVEFAEGKLPNVTDCSFLCHAGGKKTRKHKKH